MKRPQFVFLYRKEKGIMAIITTIINNKGGVGKTSSCTAMGSILGALGYRCLMIDNDFQGNTTATFIPENQEIKKHS